MKNQFLLLALLFTASVCNAQFETGKKVIGGQVGLSFFRTDNNSITGSGGQRNFHFSSSLSLSRFKSPTLLNGFGLSYIYETTRYDPASQTNRFHGIGGFVNSTKLQSIAKKFYLTFTGTIGAGLSFSKSQNAVATDNTSSTGYSFYISGGMGLLYQLNQRFLLTGSMANLLNISYNFTTSTTNNVYHTDMHNVQVGGGLNNFTLNTFVFGAKYILKK